MRKPKRIFQNEPTWQENAVDCALFFCAILAIYAILYMAGVRP